MQKLFVAALFVGLACAFPSSPKANVCGYDSCPASDPNKLNVHMVPHTHDDVGWLKTVDQYYYGSKTNVQNAGVQYILDSVVDALAANPNRKFIYVETSFFWKWWVEQTPEQQELVKQLVNNGQLEFIGGGWTMNDEATTHYLTTIDQFTWGLRRLNDTFGTCGQPKIGWQIDPFGHAKEQASLMAQYNFDGLFFARLDFQDMRTRRAQKTMELVWEGDQNLGDYADLFTGVLYNFYNNPPGFCFDVLCSDDPIIDNPDIPDYNVPQRVSDFVSFVKEQQTFFQTNNIILTMGSDFQYQDAGLYFKNMDKLIKYVNELNPDINAFYSTPSCYVKSLNAANVTWTTKQDDFFPYGSGENTYWTGYFTSRPTLKRFERIAHNILQAGKQLATIAGVSSDEAEKLDVHREAQGILQHHDAVTGTEKQNVAEDYARILQIGVASSESVIAGALNTLIRKDSAAPDVDFVSCPLRNISVCPLTESSDTFLITLYNPLSRNNSAYARVPVADSGYVVLDPSGNEVPSQILEIPASLAKLPGRESTSHLDLLFNAADLPPLGYRTYYVAKSNNARANQRSRVWKPTPGEDVTVGEDNLSLTFDGKTGLLKTISNGREIYDTVQSLEYYVGAIGDNGAEERRSSGAYILRPTTDDTIAIADGSDVTIVDGPVVSEVHQFFSDWANQVIRHYYGDDIVEFEWLVGPIPVDDGNGKEVVTKYRTNLNTDGLFTSDSNGRNDLVRQRNSRATWELDLKEPVGGNYYPVALDIWIDNGTDRLALMTDRAAGGSSIRDGELEVMIHRRLLHDDAFGVGEAINEEAFGEGLVARGKHHVLVGPTDGVASSRAIRLREQRVVSEAVVFLTDVSGQSFSDVQSSLNLEYTALTKSLPEEVQLLTLEPWKDGTLLLRLENIFTAEQSPDPVTVDISDAFATFTITSAKETTLAANQWLEDATRLQWKKEGSANLTPAKRPAQPVALDAVELQPKEIRTFVVTITRK